MTLNITYLKWLKIFALVSHSLCSILNSCELRILVVPPDPAYVYFTIQSCVTRKIRSLGHLTSPGSHVQVFHNHLALENL